VLVGELAVAEFDDRDERDTDLLMGKRGRRELRSQRSAIWLRISPSSVAASSTASE
jgi:hypothetical protein